MTFQEAKSVKDGFGITTFIKQNITYEILVTPMRQDDLMEYRNAYVVRDLADEDAQMFSTDHSYTVRGLADYNSAFLYMQFDDLVKEVANIKR